MPDIKKWLEDLRNEYYSTIAIERSTDNITAFAGSSIVAELRNYGTIICELEEYRLPWVTALICNSAGSLLQGKEEKYENILPLYCHGTEQVIVNALNLDFEIFHHTVIPFVDQYIIEKMSEYETKLSDAVDDIEKKILASEERIKETKKDLKKEEELIDQVKTELKELQENKQDIDEESENKTDEKNSVVSIYEDIDSLTQSAPLEDEKNLEKALDDPIEKKKSELAAIESIISTLTEEIQETNRQKDNLERFLAPYKSEVARLAPYIEALNEVNKTFDQMIHDHLEACYAAINTGNSKDEDELIEMLLQGQKLDEVRIEIQESSDTIDNIFMLMNKGKYHRVGIDIIVSMLNEDILDITDDRLRQFLLDNTNLLKQYLIDNLKSDMLDISADPLYHKLFNVALEQEAATDEMLYSELWDEIESSSIWDYIVEYLDNEEALAKVVTNIRGRVMRSFLETIETHSINMPGFAQALSKQKDANSDMIFRIIQNYDKKLSKANRDLRRANKRMDIQEGSGAAKVFSALYGPMEKLEMLTYDIKVYNGEIKKTVIASQMMECVSSFRKGLTELEVFPLEDFDTWKLQREIDYDSAKHRYEDGKVKRSKKVTVKTLGYSYITKDTNGDEEEHLEYSKVVPVKE